MNVKPYIPSSERNRIAWENLSQILGVHPVIIREVYFKKWFTGVDIRDFMELVEEGEIKKDEFAGVELTEEEIQKRQSKFEEHSKERDFSDYLNYFLKGLIQIGDEIVCSETKTYTFSGDQYLTQGKRYKIISLEDFRSNLSGFTAITETDLPGGQSYWSEYGIRSLWREGKEIWNWHASYYTEWIKNNPDDQKDIEFKEASEINSFFASQGLKSKYD